MAFVQNIFLSIALLLVAYPSGAHAAKDCRANIAKVTCHVTGDPNTANPLTPRACAGDEAPYVRALTKVYADLPPKIAQMFCHIRRINIEETYEASAYTTQFAEVVRDADNQKMVQLKGFVLGLSRKKIFASGFDLGGWINHKEQILMGRSMDTALLPGTPVIQTKYEGITSDALLLSTVIHEFGHMFDGANDLIHYDRDGNPSGLWASLSWNQDGKIRPEDRFFGDFQTCYYDCGDGTPKLNVGQMNALYRGLLDKASFASVYASVNPAEDLAETFLLYVSETYFYPMSASNRTFFESVTFAGEDAQNLNSLRYRGRVKAKMDYMAMFDAMPWRYEAELSQMPLKEYKNLAPIPRD